MTVFCRGLPGLQFDRGEGADTALQGHFQWNRGRSEL